MKKIIIGLFCILLPNICMADIKMCLTYVTNINDCKYVFGQKYLFANETIYTEIKDLCDAGISDIGNITPSSLYLCDESEKTCYTKLLSGAVLSDSVHGTGSIFKCANGKWELVASDKCQQGDLANNIYDYKGKDNNNLYYYQSAVMGDVCYVKCNQGEQWDLKQRKCVNNNKNNTPGWQLCVKNRNCDSLGDKKDECIACCMVKKEVAIWENNVCKCIQNKDGISQVFQIQKQGNNVIGGYCEAQNQENQNQILQEENDEEEVIVTGQEDQKVQQQEEPAKQAANEKAKQQSRTKITSTIKLLDDISGRFELSVWKDEDGNFNTARLVSDSVAGVVLGTAGGLITSNVVKKNQIKSGFEDIKCTIGGQVVADWGDQFRVGIR